MKKLMVFLTALFVMSQTASADSNGINDPEEWLESLCILAKADPDAAGEMVAENFYSKDSQKAEYEGIKGTMKSAFAANNTLHGEFDGCYPGNEFSIGTKLKKISYIGSYEIAPSVYFGIFHEYKGKWKLLNFSLEDEALKYPFK